MRIGSMMTDEAKEEQGVRKDIGEGGWIHVARWGNPNFRKMMDKLLEPYQRAGGRGMRPVPDAEDRRMMAEVIAHTILLDFGGIKDLDGTTPEYSIEVAIRWLETASEFRKIVVKESQDVEAFLIAQRDDTATALGNESIGT